MNSRFVFPTLAAALLASAPAVRAAPRVTVTGTVTDSPTLLVLDLAADTGGADLRGFGVRVTYNDAALTLADVGSYDGLWFLRGNAGVSLPYTDFRATISGAVKVIGGRFDGTRPGDGVSGQGILLATLVFKRISTASAKFGLALAEPSPFTNFATTAGDSLDGNVVFAAIQTLHAGIPGADALLQRIDDFHGSGPQGFYRLRTHFPTAGR